MLAICDGTGGCKKEFRIAGFEVGKLDNGIEKTYFKCPHCNKEYVAFYTDEDIREKQEEMRALQARYHKAKKVKVLRRIQKLQAEIGRDMDKLKQKHEANLLE